MNFYDRKCIAEDRQLFTPAGSRTKVQYTARVLKDGSLELVPTGVINIWEKIQSYAESCSIDNILERYARGDEAALFAFEGLEGDLTGMPTTMAEVLQKVIDGQNLFDSLPLEKKEAFGNDFNKWFAAYGSEDWFRKMGAFDDAAPEVKETSDEQKQ